jgi:hypothetical protein
MSREIWEIGKEKQQLYRKSAERLVAAGADLDLPSSAPARTPWVKITQVPEMLGSYVRMSPGGWLFVVLVRIVALAPKIVIQEYRLSSREWDVAAWFPGDPRENRSSDSYYRLPDRSDFHRDDVLNHRVGTQGTLRRGDTVEGWLLGQSFEPIPDRYTHGCFMPICLSILDQFEAEEQLTVELHVDRTAGRPHARPARSHLFERVDGRIDSPNRTAELPVADASNIARDNSRREGLQQNPASRSRMKIGAARCSHD